MLQLPVHKLRQFLGMFSPFPLQLWFLDQLQHHHLSTCYKNLNFLDPVPDILNQTLWRWAQYYSLINSLGYSTPSSRDLQPNCAQDTLNGNLLIKMSYILLPFFSIITPQPPYWCFLGTHTRTHWNIYKYAMEILQVGFQTTTVKWVSEYCKKACGNIFTSGETCLQFVQKQTNKQKK